MTAISSAPKIVMIGGGTGNFTLLSSLKHYVKDLTAVVNMVDDGGSTGVLRDELGVLPPGDIRQCLIALADAPDALRDLFNYRFEEGTFAGHSFGNLFLTVVEKQSDDFGQAVALASEVLSVKGSVVPVTLIDTELVMQDKEKVIKGQHSIEVESFSKGLLPSFRLDPVATINPLAAQAIAQADLVVIAPGNMFSSLVPNFLVEGMKEALQATEARLVQVVNLVNKPGQTDDMMVHDHVDVIESYIGKDTIDHVIYNNSMPPKSLLDTYAASGELPVEFDTEILERRSFKAHGADLISQTGGKKQKGDLIKRSLIRHNADEVSRKIMRIFYS